MAKNRPKKTKLAYLAGPYSHDSGAIRHKRFIDLTNAAAYLFKQGYFVFSPISSSHPMKEIGGLEGDWKYWAGFDTFMINLCDEMIIVELNGWRESVGVNAEIEIAKKLGKPIRYMDQYSFKIFEGPLT